MDVELDSLVPIHEVGINAHTYFGETNFDSWIEGQFVYFGQFSCQKCNSSTSQKKAKDKKKDSFFRGTVQKLYDRRYIIKKIEAQVGNRDTLGEIVINA